MNFKTFTLFCGSMLLLLFSCVNGNEKQAHIRQEVKRFFRKADAARNTTLQEQITDSAYFKLQTSENDTLRRSLLFNVAARYEALGAKKNTLRYVNWYMPKPDSTVTR